MIEMNLEPQIIKPLNFRLSHHGYTILGDGKVIKNIPLTPGAMLGGDHYGFTLIIDHNGKQYEITYPTQGRVIAVEIKNNILLIYEEGKYSCWQIDMHGNVIKSAQFLNISEKDIDYLSELGIRGKDAIAEVNRYSYIKK